jgi:hypothetical protein
VISIQFIILGTDTYGIGVANNVGIRESADVLNEWFHLWGTQGTVQTKSHWFGVAKRGDKGFTSLTRQGTTTLIDNGT